MTVSRTICLGFLAVITLGSLLLMMPFSVTSGTWGDPITALFTTTSAVCVTGLAVVDTGTYFSTLGQGILLLLIQVGGLGYMTATTFLLLLLGRRFGLRDRLALQQSLDMPGMKGVVQLVRSIIATTLIFELTGIFIMLPAFSADYGLDRGLWLAIFHSISAFNNAGFSLFPDNLVGYVSSPLVNIAVTGLVIWGGIGYQVIMELFLWLRDRLLRRPECVVFSLNFKIVTSTTLVLLIGGTVLVFCVEFDNPATLGALDWNGKLWAAWFHSVITRTAGFNSISVGQMETASLFASIAFMFVGAGPGSTGGGIKTTTLRILYVCTKAVLQGKEYVHCYQRQIPLSLILKAVGVVVGSMATVVGSTILISLFDPDLQFIEILFEAVSAFGTVGLSMGITADTSVLTKLVLIMTMYVGRVGVLLLMSALLGDPKPSVVRYPEEELLVG
ncbi:TrkH family potassium uptake protein [Geitlerinema sp. PCC 7407]|uniref:TrkH family potassium uptake protein n=1 Tax=Geitlerinema sp. PCC 7407 TaxID=1173025 RepID=UPI00029FD675|nr:TrkH family potassium uptake protein [Geitlerinema sp. PCC 7407]AFY64575.1 potassium uptake protein, TrkH family [Geitlerinema sp. PCC 7407]